ncbi:MAG: helix-turn-helix transcriptional regulator [Clostridia bacterium]|nr:helix-turn-helix transcriptional regulator [Clostridia bacterium]
MDAGQLLAKRVKEIRSKKGLSQEEMAFLCGTHASHIGQLEWGERNPTLETLEGIALGLNISISELLDFDLEPEVDYYDTLTNKIIACVLRLPESEKKQILTIAKVFARENKSNKGE